MIYGLYLSAQGADAQSTQLDVVANNLANAQTTGFKRDLALLAARNPYDMLHGFNSHPPGNLNASTGGTEVVGVATDFSQGSLSSTGGRFDVAISGPGFFQVSDGYNEFLTRNGAFTLDRTGQLVTKGEGHTVLTPGGVPVVVPAEARDIDISTNGTVFAIDEAGVRSAVSQIALVEPSTPDALLKLGSHLYRSTAPVAPAGEATTVTQGSLETSGTNSIQEMMQMIQASRAFESNVSMIRFQDESLGQLLQTVSRQ